MLLRNTTVKHHLTHHPTIFPKTIIIIFAKDKTKELKTNFIQMWDTASTALNPSKSFQSWCLKFSFSPFYFSIEFSSRFSSKFQYGFPSCHFFWRILVLVVRLSLWQRLINIRPLQIRLVRCKIFIYIFCVIHLYFIKMRIFIDYIKNINFNTINFIFLFTSSQLFY